ncbi:E3 ubiquitin protein ligase drip2 [Quillaja saponaria]|uniref:E3 ubiquitin protein ligase drip2 n=1 Tax=Quillaja saponaria TaxID=32244 RepID=A0AAD7PJU6_QUISA|nr:E3 ubiquitin protein ligase drip2 [Quillaja saponaria]
MVPAAQNLSKQKSQQQTSTTHHRLHGGGYGGDCIGGYYTTDEINSGGGRQQGYDYYKNCYDHSNTSSNYSCLGDYIIGSNHLVLADDQMADHQEDESRTCNTNTSLNEPAGSSSFKNINNIMNISHRHADDQQDVNRPGPGPGLGPGSGDETSWLQLSIGCQSNTAAQLAVTASHCNIYNKLDDDYNSDLDPNNLNLGGRGSRFAELELLPSSSTATGAAQYSAPELSGRTTLVPMFHQAPGPSISYTSTTNTSTSSLFFQNVSVQGSGSGNNIPYYHHSQEINWASFRPMPNTMAMGMGMGWMPSSSSSSSSSLRPPPPHTTPHLGVGSFLGIKPFQFHGGAAGLIDHATGPSSSSDQYVRVIDPPRRPHSGIWFTLQASPNQPKEPYLSQITKSYLRIKDGRMTIRLLMKYLVDKLSLESESEIEITCRGQQLLPFLTLQHVRDNIWSPKDAVTLLSDSSSTPDHVMVLHYGRRST